MTRYRKTAAYVDLTAIRHNVRALIRATGTPLMAVVKADAYGHGLIPVARAALESGACALAVAIPEEGEALRQAGISADVLVLGNVDKDGAEASARLGLLQTISDERGVLLLAEACERLDVTARAHLKLDTGMHRIGARGEGEISRILAALASAPRVRLVGAFSHLADADGDSPDFTLSQLARFDELLAFLPAGLTVHCAASAGMLRFPAARRDMTRAGIALYGCPPVASALDLHPAMRLEAEVVFVKDIAPGDCVSYGCTWRAERPTRLATLAIGYGDGYLRACSGRAQVLMHGRRCPVVGRVCMDQMMADVTGAPDVACGDMAVLLGAQGDERITADELAGWADTICYEVLLSLNARVPRLYIDR